MLILKIYLEACLFGHQTRFEQCPLLNFICILTFRIDHDQIQWLLLQDVYQIANKNILLGFFYIYLATNFLTQEFSQLKLAFFLHLVERY